jgi:hypothetical protein
MVRKLTLAAVLVAAAGGSSGCVINQYASDPNIRMEQLVNQSEDYRQIGEFWRRFWFNDMPSHLTTERINGGIMR